MISNSDILKVLFRYLSGEIALAPFRERLIESDLAAQIDHDGRNLLHQIEGCYAEFSDGLVDEAFLKQRLRGLMNPIANTVANPAQPPMVVVETIQSGQIVLGTIHTGSTSGYSTIAPSGAVPSAELEMLT